MLIVVQAATVALENMMRSPLVVMDQQTSNAFSMAMFLVNLGISSMLLVESVLKLMSYGPKVNSTVKTC